MIVRRAAIALLVLSLTREPQSVGKLGTPGHDFILKETEGHSNEYESEDEVSTAGDHLDVFAFRAFCALFGGEKAGGDEISEANGG